MDQPFAYSREVSGPFDLTEVNIQGDVIDFGAIIIPNQFPDLTIRVEVEEGTSRGVALTLEQGGSALQLSLFAAPKSGGVLSEVLDQLETTFREHGASLDRSNHIFGETLRVERVGSGDSKPMRFIGVDGPRWFLRGVVTGEAVDDTTEAIVIENIMKSVVINRGEEPLPPRELIALTLPQGSIAPPRSV